MRLGEAAAPVPVFQFTIPRLRYGSSRMAQGIVNWLACMGMLVLAFIEIARVF